MAGASKPRRRLALYATAFAATAGVAIAVGPGAAWIVDHIADGQRVWRLGQLKVDGVSGPWLGALRADTATIADEAGIWLEARDLQLDWRPFDLFAGVVHLDQARIGRVDVLRLPALSAGRRGGASIDVDMASAEVLHFQVAERVFGDAAEFRATLSLDVNDSALDALQLRLERSDADTDRLVAAYDRDFALNLDMEGRPGGVFARALGVPDQAVSAAASGDGDAQSGAMEYRARIGVGTLLAGQARWAQTQWSLGARADLSLLPALQSLVRRIGPNLSLQASGARNGPFSAHAETPFLLVDARGAVDAHLTLDGAAHFVATSERVSDIARESPFPLGAARLEGELRRGPSATAIRATLTASEAEAFGEQVRLSGPVEAALTQQAFTLSANLGASNDPGPLFRHTQLHTTLSYDIRRRRFSLDRATLVSEAARAEGRGWYNRGEGEFAGEWRVRKLRALALDLDGEASGNWRSLAVPEREQRVWTTTITGAGAAIGGRSPLAQVLGGQPGLDARLRNENGGITVSHARVDGARLRVGAAGRIVRGHAALSLEASARGPVTIGEVEFAGIADARGRLSGRIARPALALETTMPRLAALGVDIEHPIVTLNLTPEPRGYSGHAQIRGLVMGQTLRASSPLALTGGALSFPSLDARLGQVLARGSATLGGDPSASITLSGALDGLATDLSGRIEGSLSYQTERITLNAQLTAARAGALRFRTARVSAEGKPRALAARVDLAGRLREAPLTFAGTGDLKFQNGGADFSLIGSGALAEAPIRTRAPMRISHGRARFDAVIDVALGDGAVTAQWRERGRGLTGSARVEHAPLSPLAAIWGERATGHIDGRLSLASAGRELRGDADLTLSAARFAGRQRGALDLRVVGALDRTRLTAALEATSADGLTAHFEADAPVTTDANPIRIALVPERRGRARWSLNGPAASLWAATRLQNQTLDGDLSGEGELLFGAGHLSGDGRIEIANGRFEDKLSAVTLLDLNARVAINEGGVAIEQLSAAGANGGRLTATGGSANPREGRIAVRVDNMRIVNRPDARATASGDLVFTWEGLHSNLSGALDIVQADLDIAANPEAGIAVIDVVEINRADAAEPEEAPRPQRNGSTILDVRVRAPGRVFTRGRGVEAEWALDLRLDGTARHPFLYGEARAVRGTMALSGQPFEIESARVFFNGDPLDAQIDLTAQRDTADLSARIRLTGTARDPEIAFSSDPALPEDEILPQILFGRGVADLSPFEAAQLAGSLAALSGRASLDLVDAARAAAGLDRFNVRQDEDGGFLVSGGVYLTRDVYVEVARTGLGQAQTRLEWTVRPRLVLVTSFRGNGDQRVSLRWRRESD